MIDNVCIKMTAARGDGSETYTGPLSHMDAVVVVGVARAFLHAQNMEDGLSPEEAFRLTNESIGVIPINRVPDNSVDKSDPAELVVDWVCAFWNDPAEYFANRSAMMAGIGKLFS